MDNVSEEQFERLVSEAIDAIPKPYSDHLDNVAFLIEDEPTREQVKLLGLHCNSLLFGLYEGVPLPQRMGVTKLLPDKITLFKKPLTRVSRNMNELKVQINKTIWHEVAHYYGLDHARIHELEKH